MFTDSTSTPVVEDGVRGEVLLNYQGSINPAGRVVGVRGAVTLAAGSTLASGFEYGTEGKFILQGTLNNGSGFSCGVLAQLDISAAGIVHTSGYLAPLICDVGASASLSSDANLNGIFVSNNTACKMNAMVKGNIHASFVFDLSDPQGDYSWFASSAGSSAGKALMISIGGATYKIPLNQ